MLALKFEYVHVQKLNLFDLYSCNHMNHNCWDSCFISEDRGGTFHGKGYIWLWICNNQSKTRELRDLTHPFSLKGLKGLTSSVPHTHQKKKFSTPYYNNRVLFKLLISSCFVQAYPFEINWNATYCDPMQPLVVDIGSGTYSPFPSHVFLFFICGPDCLPMVWIPYFSCSRL